ncbi:MAG: GGDEF domain-containing protein [Bacilli bacterium]|nr:GGDEF domain-containing protein [Bacilli bacterium]
MDTKTEVEELKRKFHLSKDSIAKALASDFVCSFFINKKTGRFIQYSSSELYNSLNLPTTGDDFFSIGKNSLLETLYPEDRDLVITAINKENVLRVLTIDISFSIICRVVLQSKPIYIEIKINNMIDDDEHMVAGIRNIDAHMKRIEEYERQKKNHLTFAGLAEALAADYSCLLYVDTKNDRYQEYYSTGEFKTLEIPSNGTYILSGENGLRKHVYEDDLPIYDAACNKKNILKVLSIDHSFALNIRFVLEGKPTYCRIKISKMMLEDEFHVVVGITNIDEQIKREENYIKSIDEVKEIAYRDPLTGVKSKHAYADAEVSINERIKMGIIYDFGIVVADVNGLKRVNDTYGHRSGDEYLKAACWMICNAFSHSPVYRIGGDEFVVILEGEDYENRHKLIEEIDKAVDKNHPLGKPSISIGMSEFQLSVDKDVHSVFDRADKLMYQRKQVLKAIRND